MSQTSFVRSLSNLYFSIPRGWICDDQALGLMRRFYLWVFLAALLHGGFFLLPVVEQFGQTDALQALAANIPQSKTTLIRIETKRGTDSAPQAQAVEKPLQVESEISVAPEVKAVQPSVTQPAQQVAVEKKVQPTAKPVDTQSVPAKSVRTQVENVVSQVVEPVQQTPTVVSSKGSQVLNGGQSVSDVANVVAEVKEGVSRLMAKPISTRKPKYPRRAIVRNQQGSVSVELLISEDGLVERAELLKSSGYELLDRSVMKFVDKERFIAALEQGQPIASTQLFTFRFVLN